jgi:hypothetical protein
MRHLLHYSVYLGMCMSEREKKTDKEREREGGKEREGKRERKREG